MNTIAAALSRHRPAQLDSGSRTRASVALLLRQIGPHPDIFFIQRATHERDPWSGDLGFPGGRVESGESPEETAKRETLEEVGIDLENAVRLGQLDDLTGAHLPVQVSCYVYRLPGSVAVSLNHEVENYFWFSLKELTIWERHRSTPVRFGGKPLVRPAIHLLEPPGPVLWGITYRLVRNFLDILGRPLPEPE